MVFTHFFVPLRRQKRINDDMKKTISRLVLLCTFMLTTNVSSAQDLNDVLNAVLGGANSDMAEGLTSVFSANKQATADKIIGTWVYEEPAIVFTSDNLLTKAGAKIASNKIENKIQEQLNKYGIKPGAFTMTFNEDGTVTETLGKKTYKGKWSIKDSKLQLTVTGVRNVAITTQISGSRMQFVTDATKLLNMFKAFGAKSTNSNIKTITSLMKNVKGMQTGVTLKKQ